MDKIENNAYATILRTKQNVSHTQMLRKSIVQSLYHTYGACWRKLSGGKNLACSVTENQRDEDDDETCCWNQVKWHDIKVGDILKLRRDDAIPADVVLLYGSGEDRIAYVETMALDGETNLKSKQATPALPDCHKIESIKTVSAEFTLEVSFVGYNTLETFAYSNQQFCRIQTATFTTSMAK